MRALSSMVGRATLAAFAVTALVAVTVPWVHAQDGDEAAPTLFYFYSPDWRPADLNDLTASIETLVARHDIDLRFQAFAHYDDFLARIQHETPAYLVAPSWLEKVDVLGFVIEPIARPRRGTLYSYRKALMAGEGVDGFEALSRGTIAATVYTMGPGGARGLLDTFNLDATTAKVIPVAKDIDALLALSFGQVQAALVTSAQFNMPERANPKITDELEALAFSPAIPFPGVYATERASDDSRERMAAVLGALGDDDGGRELLRLFGYDAFVVDAAILARVPRPGDPMIPRPAASAAR